MGCTCCEKLAEKKQPNIINKGEYKMGLIIGILLLVIGFGIALTTYTMIDEYRRTKKEQTKPAPDITSIIIAALYTLVTLAAGVFYIFH